MAEKVLYQTVKDKGNHKEIETKGPIHCAKDNAWLGHGFYFWDTFEELAHWWGEHRLKQPYMVWKALCDFDSDKCFDLHGEPNHILIFRKVAQEILDQKIDEDEKNITVAEVLYYIQDVLKITNYSAIRATGALSISPKNLKYTIKMPFEIGKHQFIDLLPAIQICIFNLDAMDFKEHTLIFPDKHKTAV